VSGDPAGGRAEPRRATLRRERLAAGLARCSHGALGSHHFSGSHPNTAGSVARPPGWGAVATRTSAKTWFPIREAISVAASVMYILPERPLGLGRQLLKWWHCPELFLAGELFHIVVQGLWGNDPAILLIEL